MELENLEEEEEEEGVGAGEGGESASGSGSTVPEAKIVARTFRYMRRKPTIISYKPPEGKESKGFEFNCRYKKITSRNHISRSTGLLDKRYLRET